ncbi:MAG: transcriptional regulator with XRE-family HTH domain [Cyclobacteriaceae bacterium]|jgi:transcriptional regulator with XRE-family HTH domain
MDFRTKLIEVRKANGLTQEELASKCNVTARTIQRIESGEVQPRAHTIRTLSEALGFEFFNSSKNLNNHSIFWHIKDLFNLKTHKMRKVSILSLVAIAFALTTLHIQAQPSFKKNPKSGITISQNKDNSIERIDVVFTNELTLDSLIDIKKRLSEIKISLTYTSMGFDENGQLTGIGCNMSDKQKGKGSSGGFEIPEFRPEAVVGFYYDYSKKAKLGFCNGACWIN